MFLRDARQVASPVDIVRGASRIPSPRKECVTHPKSTRQPKCFFFAFLGSGFAQILGQKVSIRLTTHKNTNLEASWHIKREMNSILVEVRRLKKVFCLLIGQPTAGTPFGRRSRTLRESSI